MGLSALLTLSCASGPTVTSPWPPLRGHWQAAEWQVLAQAADVASGTVSLVQPDNGLAVAAGHAATDGSFALFLPPSVRPSNGSTWFLDVVRRRSGQGLGLRTVVQWNGERWLSCTAGSDTAEAPMLVTTATTVAARIAERAGLPLAQTIGQVQGGQIRLPAPVDAAWPLLLLPKLQAALTAGRDPLSVSPAVIHSQTPAAPLGGDLVTWQGYGFGPATGTVTIGARPLPVRLWQDRTVQVGVPAGLPPGDVVLTLAGGEVLAAGTVALPDTWRLASPLLRPRGGDAAAAAAIGTTVYVAGGLDGSYDPIGAVDAVTPDGPLRLAAMPTARFGLGGAALNGLFYAVGGSGASGPSALVEVYDRTANSWTAVAPLPVALYQPAVVSDGTTLFVLGGESGGAPRDTIYSWKPGAVTWRLSPAVLSSPRAGAAAVVLSDGRVAVTGGRGPSGAASASLDLFDPQTDTVVAGPALAVARYSHAAVLVAGAVMVAGGWQDALGALASTEAWVPGQAAWRPRTSLPSPRFGLTGVSVGGTAWLLAGANDGEATGADVLVYQP